MQGMPPIRSGSTVIRSKDMLDCTADSLESAAHGIE